MNGDNQIARELEQHLRRDGHNVTVDVKTTDDTKSGAGTVVNVNIHMIGPKAAYIARWLAYTPIRIARRLLAALERPTNELVVRENPDELGYWIEQR